MRTVSRLRLLFCLINGHRLPCCPLCYLLPCRNYAGPSKRHLCFVNPLSFTQLNLIKQVGHNAVYLCFIIILLVDLGGFAPPSRTLFSSLHTAITLITKNLCKHSSSIIEGHCFTLLHNNWYHVTHLLGHCLLLILSNALSH